MAFHHVIKSLQRAKPARRIWRPSLELGAITVYMINALVYRPGDGQAETTLLNSTCQHVALNASNDSDDDDDDDDDMTEPIGYNRGLYFVSDLVLDKNCYRLSANRQIGADMLAVLYRKPGLKAIDQEFSFFHPAGIETQTNPNRIYNRRTKTLDLRYVRPDEDIAPEFNLEARGVNLKPRARMTGEDIRFGGSDSDEDAEGIDIHVTKIFRQFPYDVFQVAPNRKSHKTGSWILLDDTARSGVRIDVFKTLDLSLIFDEVQYRIVDQNVWKDVVFARYFPAKGQKPPKALQNFPAATYYKDWIDLMNRLSTNDANLVRRTMFRKFDELHWVPYPASDRMWATKSMTTRGWIRLPPGKPQACPQLAINDKWRRGRPVVVKERREEQDTGVDSA
jgi:hypothetical protein